MLISFFHAMMFVVLFFIAQSAVQAADVCQQPLEAEHVQMCSVERNYHTVMQSHLSEVLKTSFRDRHEYIMSSLNTDCRTAVCRHRTLHEYNVYLLGFMVRNGIGI